MWILRQRQKKILIVLLTGKEEWKKTIREFYGPFEDELKKAQEEIDKIEIKEEVSDVQCDKCGRMMVIKYGRYGKFLACPRLSRM